MMENYMETHWKTTEEQKKEKGVGFKELERQFRKHNILLPDGSEQMVRSYTGRFFQPLSIQDVDGIVEGANFWKNFFVPEDQEKAYIQLILISICKLCRMQVCVFTTNDAVKSFVAEWNGKKIGRLNENYYLMKIGYDIKTCQYKDGKFNLVDCPDRIRKTIF